MLFGVSLHPYWRESILTELGQYLASTGRLFSRVADDSDFISDFRKLYFPSHLGKYFIKMGKISVKIHEIGKIKAIFGLGMTPI